VIKEDSRSNINILFANSPGSMNSGHFFHLPENRIGGIIHQHAKLWGVRLPGQWRTYPKYRQYVAQEPGMRRPLQSIVSYKDGTEKSQGAWFFLFFLYACGSLAICFLLRWLLKILPIIHLAK